MDANTPLRLSTFVSAGALVLAYLTLANPVLAKSPERPDYSSGVHLDRPSSVHGSRLLVIPVSGIAAGRHGGVIKFMSGDKVLRSVRYRFDSEDAAKQSLLLPVDGGDPVFVQRLQRLAEDPASSVEISVSLDGHEYAKFTLAQVEDMSRDLLSQGTAHRIASLRFVNNVIKTVPAPKLTNLSALAPVCDAEYLEIVEQEYGECLDRCDDGQAGPTESCIHGCEFTYWERTHVELEAEYTESHIVYAVDLTGNDPTQFECYRTGHWPFTSTDLYARHRRVIRKDTIQRWYVCGSTRYELVAQSYEEDICFQFRMAGPCNAYENLRCSF